MGDFLAKFENFLFDILGLVLPGLIFLLILASPACLLDITKIPQKFIDASYILSALVTFARILKLYWANNLNIILAIVAILSYLLGHFIKVFSIIVYDFLSTIFDKIVNKFIGYLYIKGKGAVSMNSQSRFYLFLQTAFSPIKSTIIKVFTFNSPNYFSDNDPLRTACVNIINQRLNISYPDKWYSIYKFANMINGQESQRSLASNFLAKYNLYRSLSFIFLFTTIYYKCFLNAASLYISPELTKIASLFLITSLLLWFTFNYKFKRYWTLCGNETLVSLYYFLNKKKLNEG